MRRRREKDEKVKKMVVLFLTGLMVISVFSVIFFGFGATSAKVTENKAKFVKKGQAWTTMIDKHEALFTNLPSSVDHIEVSNEIIQRISNTIEIDTTFDPNSSFNQSFGLAQYQMGITLQNFNIFVRAGTTSNISERVPIITCNDSTPVVPVIYFKEGNETKVFLEDDCIIAQVNRAIDAIAVKDRLLYGKFGIIK